MIDPRFYKRKKLGTALTALAGPAANLLLGFVLTILLLSCSVVYFYINATGWVEKLLTVIYNLLDYGVMINIGLGIFNLIPISPLDGSKVLGALLPINQFNKLLRYEKYGYIILILLLFDVPARILTAGGVSESIAQYFGLFYYLDIARTFVTDLYHSILIPVFDLFL
jgi:Zn-dependent protease